MAVSLQDYARLVLFYNGNALQQVTSIEMTTNSGQQRVDLLNEGLAGFTPGAGDVSLSVGFAVPIGGPEDDFQEHCAEGAYVDLQVGVGRKDYVGRGKIMDLSISQSTGASVEGTFTWTGQLKAFS